MVADWESEKEIFCRALALPPEQRLEFLGEACVHDAELRARICRLLEYHRGGCDFFSRLEEEMGAVDLRAPSLANGEVVANRFEIRRFLARGGSGEVYEAYDRELDEPVALKVLWSGWAEDSIERFKTEVRLARRIQNPYVCRVHDVGRVERPDGLAVLFFSMELLGGETLSAYLRKKGPLKTAEALFLLKQVADGLQAAHRLGVLHRDLKGGNIMLAPESGGKFRAVLTDFGLAALESQSCGQMAGTPAYMAPEQVAGRPLSRATDIYALGVILYEMLTGRLPFAGTTALEQAHARLTESPVGPRAVNPGIDARWERAILKCLARDPQDRFAEAVDLVRALEPPRKVAVPITVGVAAAAAVVGFSLWSASREAGSAPRGSVLVVPFEVAGGVERRQGAAFSADLKAELANVPGVRVVAQATGGGFQGRRSDLHEIRRQLKAGAVLSGSIEPAPGGQMQIDASLTDSGSGYVLWSHRFEAAPKDLPRVEQTIVLAGVQALQVELAPPGVRAIEKRHSQNPEAYQAYLLGEYCAGTRDTGALTQAIAYYRRAIELDPHYALAEAGLAQAYTIVATRGILPPQEAHRLSEEAADRAMASDPDLPEALLVKGSNAQRVFWDWDAAERYLRRCTQLAPGLGIAHQWLAGLLSILGRHADAIAEGSLAHDLDPLSPTVASSYAMLLYRARRYKEARAELEWVVKREPAFLNAQVLLAEVCDQMGRPAEAVALVEKAAAAGRASYALADLGYHYARAGRIDDAHRVASELETRYAQGAAMASEVASVYVGLNDPGAACSWLTRGLPAREVNLTVIKVDPAFDALRGSACFRDLMEALRL